MQSVIFKTNNDTEIEIRNPHSVISIDFLGAAIGILDVLEGNEEFIQDETIGSTFLSLPGSLTYNPSEVENGDEDQDQNFDTPVQIDDEAGPVDYQTVLGQNSEGQVTLFYRCPVCDEIHQVGE
jgi:hypothetical protein